MAITCFLSFTQTRFLCGRPLKEVVANLHHKIGEEDHYLKIKVNQEWYFSVTRSAAWLPLKGTFIYRKSILGSRAPLGHNQESHSW